MRDNPTKGMINMAKGDSFIDKIRRGEVCIGTSISLRDPVTTEALATSGLFDILWIEMEHMAISLETVERHVMATKGTNVMTIVRVGWNDPVLIKPVLDIGVPAVIVPLVQTADDVRNAVKACRYPPDGIRGFGPRRSADTLEFGGAGGPDWIKKANEEMITVVQIEHIEAVNNLDEILSVPNLNGVYIGPADMSSKTCLIMFKLCLISWLSFKVHTFSTPPLAIVSGKYSRTSALVKPANTFRGRNPASRARIA
mgnify:CR=1 FL=1